MSAAHPTSPEHTDLSRVDVDRVRRRTVTVLAVAQVLAGLAAGSVVTVGSLLAVRLSGSEAWAGWVTAAATFGAAWAALLLARLAVTHGRRRALSTGLAVAVVGAAGVVVSTVVESFGLLLVAATLLGVGSAVNLQSRFAATDLSTDRTRSRDLSLVVWSSTVGAVVGPNLAQLDRAVGRVTGLPEHANVFVLGGAGMLAALLVVAAGLRPEPLDVAGRAGGVPGTRTAVPVRAAVAVLRQRPQAAAAVLGVVAVHAVMVAVMSVTPVHLEGHHATVQVVTLTISVHLAAMFALSPVMGAVADAVGPWRVLAGGLVLVLAAVTVCSVGEARHAAVAVGLGLLGLGWSAATVAGSAVLAGTVQGPERVAVQGLSDALMSLAGAAGGALTGLALAGVGYGGLNVVAGAVVVAAACAVVVLARRPAVGATSAA